MTKARDNYGKALAFVEQALVAETDDCIIWPFALVGRRYPSIRITGQRGNRAHRIVCERKHGAPPFAKAEAAHKCGVRICVNHRHLRWATHAQNMADSIDHGTFKGEQSPRAKLTEKDVLAIRASTDHYAAVAKQFGITTTHYYYIRNRTSWGHI